MIKRLTILSFLILSVSPLRSEITGIYTYPGGANGDVQINNNGAMDGRTLTSTGTITITTTSTQIIIGSSGSAITRLSDLSDADDSSRSIGSYLCFDGTNWIAIQNGGNCSFSISSFSDGLSTNIEIGAGVWKSSGSISFTASYNNGPPTGSTITASGWSALPLSNPYTSATSVANMNYPSVSGTVVFTLNSTKSGQNANASITHTFVNRVYYGISSVTSGFTGSDVTGLASSVLQDSRTLTFTVNPGASQYIVYAFPSRLGAASFSVGGFVGGFNPPETVSVTNGSGYTEIYYVYRSANPNLGSTTVVVN